MLAVEHIVIPAYPTAGRWMPGATTYALMQLGPGGRTGRGAAIRVPVRAPPGGVRCRGGHPCPPPELEEGRPLTQQDRAEWVGAFTAPAIRAWRTRSGGPRRSGVAPGDPRGERTPAGAGLPAAPDEADAGPGPAMCSGSYATSSSASSVRVMHGKRNRHDTVGLYCQPRNRPLPDGHPTAVWLREDRVLDSLTIFFNTFVLGPDRAELVAASLPAAADHATLQHHR